MLLPIRKLLYHTGCTLDYLHGPSHVRAHQNKIVPLAWDVAKYPFVTSEQAHDITKLCVCVV